MLNSSFYKLCLLRKTVQHEIQLPQTLMTKDLTEQKWSYLTPERFLMTSLHVYLVFFITFATENRASRQMISHKK